MSGRFQAGDVAIPFDLSGEMELPDKAHGVFEVSGEKQAFLRFGEENYLATPGYGFEIDDYNESGAMLLEVLKPSLGAWS